MKTTLELTDATVSVDLKSGKITLECKQGTAMAFVTKVEPTPAEARRIALYLLQAAEDAELVEAKLRREENYRDAKNDFNRLKNEVENAFHLME